MTLKILLNEASEVLKQKNVEDPSKEAGLLLSWVLGKDLGFVYTHSDLTLPDEKTREFWSVIKRRGQHEPYAYITGECEFLSLTFEVSPNVLIPRPDTELLAEAAFAAFGKGDPLFTQYMFTLPQKKTYRVLDIGTGSGCLAVSIAKHAYLSKIDAEVYAVDISEKALEKAKRNAERNHVSERVHFIQADFLTDCSLITGPYDLVVSNPPYIPSKDIPTLMPSVRDFEPHAALDGGQDGLLFYRALAEKAQSLLVQQGILAVECGFDQALQIQNLFSKKLMESIVLKDLAGINRVVAARRK